jgi:magnesium transporter
MNQVMKLLTVVSAIFIPLTFIVGVYGMNFENMPELSMKFGYYICWGIMVVITGILLFAFYKRGWFK